jgi:Protein of unknown function (DUF3224)
MSKRAEGTFEVKVAAADASAIGHQGELGRMTLDKTFAGELTGASKGEMLTGNTVDTGSMSYVALERVTGTLDGRSGSFLLMHQGTMMKTDANSGSLQITVVPASGTRELTGLSGTMAVRVQSGQHFYTFDYTVS